MLVIGLTGRNCAGKDTIAAILEARGFERHSLSDVLRDELRRGLRPITRSALIALGNDLRAREGPAVLAERVKRRFRGNRVVVVSVRNPAEVEALRALEGFTLWGVDAPADLRFERERRRSRESAPRTREAFLAAEAAENTADPVAQQLDRTLALADVVVDNGGSLEDLERRVLALLEAIDE